jgi:hypothetical protein
MRKSTLTIVFGLLFISGCGGDGNATGGSASAAECKQAPALGQATFGAGCFK